MARPDLLDAKLFKLSSKEDYVTLRDFNENTLVVGATGSGKTTGASKHILRVWIRSGGAAIVHCPKPDDVEMIWNICKEEGRTDSFVHLAPGKRQFNFLAYEMARLGEQGINSVVEILIEVVEACNAATSSIAKPEEAFWLDTKKQTLRNTLPLLFAATGSVSIANIVRFVRSAPNSMEELRDEEWQKNSFFFSIFAPAMDALSDETGQQYMEFWEEWARLDAKTRSNISISLTTALDRFNHGWLKEMFCRETTVVPELCFSGAIIVLDMPPLIYQTDGLIGQIVVKLSCQRVFLSRADRSRHIMVHCDEYQYFVTKSDALFTSTCRGSNVCMVALTQSLPSLHAAMGGENSAKRVDQLVGNFRTKIFHANGCPETNDWAARMIGRDIKRRATYNYSEGTSENFGANMGTGENSGTSSSCGTSFSANFNSGSSNSYSLGATNSSGTTSGSNSNRGQTRGNATNEGHSAGWSEQVDHIVEPGAFGRLKTGGPANGNRVSAIWYQAGRTFAQTGRNFIEVEFQQ